MSAPPPAPPAVVVTAPAPRAPITIPDLVEMTTISSLAISPNGNWVAFRADKASLARNRVEFTWYVVPVDGSAEARPIGAGGQALYDLSGNVLPEAPIWSPASNAIYYRALIDGEIQLWRASLDGSPATRLTADPANIRSLQLARDGQHITYTVDATRAAVEQAERDAFDQGTPGDGSADLAQPASRGSYIDGRLASRRSTNGWYSWSHLLWRTPTRTLSVTLPATDRHGGAVMPQASKVSWTARWEPARSHWRLIVTPAGAAPAPCTTMICDERGAVAVEQLPAPRDYLVTLRTPAQQDALVLWNPVDQTSRTILSVDGLLTGGSPLTPDCAGTQETLICVSEGPTAPPSLVRIAIASGETRALFTPNAALQARVAQSVRLVTWHDHKGEEHAARLVLPTSPKPQGGYPLVFTYYVCDGFLRGGTGGELPLFPLAEHGVATLCINRARSDYKHQDARADQAEALADIRAVTSLLAREGLIDRRRIGEWGYSFGSEVLSQVLIHTDLLAAAAAATDLVDPPVYWFQSLPGRDYPSIIRRVWKLGSPDDDRRGWAKVAPGLNIARVRAPILLQAPEYEARAMIAFWSKLSASRTPAEFWMFANESHTKIFPRHQAVTMTRNMDWFRYWLDAARDADPSKAEQYRRWDAMASRWHAARLIENGARP